MVSMKKPIKMDDEMGYPYFRKPPYGFMLVIPSGKHTKKTKNNGKSPVFMGKSTSSMAIFNSDVSLPEGT